MAPQNHAAYLLKAKANPLTVRDAPYTNPSVNEIVVAARAVSVNPIDRVKQESGNFIFPWNKYPLVMGYDVAGEIVEVGSNVSRFAVGQRVVGLALGLHKDYNRAAEGAFQEYVVLQQHMTTAIPQHIDFEHASVIPLGLSTAACALFQKDQLGLQHPTYPARARVDKTVLIWGAGTSVGLNAVQLAVAAGYTVFATSSPKRFGLIRSLGAEQIWDYNSPNVIKDIIAAFSGRQTAGAVSIGPRSADRCMDVLSKCQGSKTLSAVTFPVPDPFSVPGAIKGMTVFTVAKWYKSAVGGFTVQPFVIGDTLAKNEVGSAVWQDFLGDALQAGSYKCLPEPYVVGRGLESLQEAINQQKAIGARGQKSVVLLGA